MARTALLCTALPAGIVRIDGEWRARVSVFVSPRLTPDPGSATLAAFPALIDWPATLSALSWRIVTAGDDRTPLATTEPLMPIAGPSPYLAAGPWGSVAASSDAWRAVFPADTPVVAYPDGGPVMMAAAGAEPASYEAVPVLDAIRSVYAEALPSTGQRQAGGALRRFAGLDSAGGLLGAGGDNPLQRFAAFHRRAANPSPPLLASEEPDEHFHSIVAGLGTHAPLLRRLGLVVDLEVAAAALDLDNAMRIAVIAEVAEGPDMTDTTPSSIWTAIEVDAVTTDSYRAFCAGSRDADVHAGMHALPRDPRNISQENLEHAFMTLAQAAGDPSGEQALPALQQAGMRVLDDDLPARLGTAIAAQRRLSASLAATALQPARLSAVGDTVANQIVNETVYAEELVRGYRIDVQDADAGPWRSLCRRASRYAADGWRWPSDGSMDDEGIVEPTVWTDPNAEQSGIRIPPELFNWDGWSLVVGEPDSGIDGPGPDAGDARLTITADVPPGSLQPQRFGHRYRFRARTVDVGGNSVPAEVADLLEASLPAELAGTAPARCLRVESTKPPATFPAEPRGPGETGDAVVVRTAESPRHATARRRLHVLPPEISLRVAEKHGLFDGLTPEASWQLIQAHRGELACDEAGEEREYIADETLFAPYLPDPTARAAVLILPDGNAVPLPRFDDLGVGAPEHALARGCSLVIEPGINETRAEVRGRKVTVRVPRGRVTRLRLAARLDGDALGTSALANEEWAGRVDAAALAVAAGNGAAATLAPHRIIDIVHATQRPLTRPVFVKPGLSPRTPDATGAVLEDPEFLFDAPSTGRLDVYAEWNERRDDPAAPRWRTTTNALHAGGTRVDPDDSSPFTTLADRRAALAHDFGDTKHRVVSYRPVATSRFIDYFPESLTDDAANMQQTGSAFTVQVPSTAPPAAPEIAFILPTFRRGERRGADGSASAEQQGFGLRVYMKRGWFSSGDGERLAVVLGGPEDTGLKSAWGTDPIRATAPLPGPLSATHFLGSEGDRSAVGENLVRGFGVNDRELDLVVQEVHFGEAQGLPFADFVFASQPAALPMVRLALARYQQHAIDGCHLSAIVAADFVPLAPDRQLTAVPAGRGRWQLSLTGQGYRDVAGRTGIVTAVIEQQPERKRRDDALWLPAGESVTLAGRLDGNLEVTWAGEVALDVSAGIGRMRRRIVLREYAAGSDDVAAASLVSVQTVAL